MFQRSQVTKIVLSRCSLNVFVIVIVFVIVFIFVFAEKVWKSGSDRLHWSIACDPTEKMPVQKSEIWYWEIQLVKIKKSNSAGGLQKGGESSGRDSLGDCGNICEGNLLFRVIFGKFMHRWFLICAQLGSYNVSFLNYRPPKLKYGFFRGSFARLTSQSQAGTLSTFSPLSVTSVSTCCPSPPSARSRGNRGLPGWSCPPTETLNIIELRSDDKTNSDQKWPFWRPTP